MLIEIEGPDGSGKSTLARNLARFLECGVQAFPDYEATTGSAIRSYLEGGWGFAQYTMDAPLAFQTLQTCNRIERIDLLRRACGLSNDTLVLDRYHASSIVYGQYEGLDPAFLAGLAAVLPQPDISILVDVPPEVALKRQADRGGEASIYEGKKQRAERLRRLYVDHWLDSALLSQRRGDEWRWVMVHGNQEQDAVTTAALTMLVRRAQELR